MEGVDEIYGYHNIPNFDEGDIRVCEGPFFAKVTQVEILVTGRGGHGSTPHKLQDPITAAAMVHTALHTIKSRNIDNRENIVFTITKFQSGHTYNVFPDTAVMTGTIRSYNDKTLELVKQRIVEISENTAAAHGCKAECKIVDSYPAVVNHAEPTQHVIRLAKKFIGEEHFCQEELPLSASEDFSYFLHEKPGCFFALGTM
jgi:hippurate hydrolase